MSDTKQNLSAIRRAAALKSWEATGDDPDARSERTAPARQARRATSARVNALEETVAELAARVAELQRAS